ncbi:MULTISPECIES: gliding motility-associated C-terminal domain-containing protein [Flavobacterium]|uniref:HYR-like domain-containing protein n=1 Tax=Flavobacterium TaxID=237 RepID=UPI001FCA721A|nr:MULTISPECIES: gliding motility-associated C-terminal domain-containing protein [Flavobacterium]UOK41811.1 gliding motility-associated C-terminal domain-containing protein [Flavobacterium enshiense]
MKPKITLFVLFFLMGINNVFPQFTPQKPDLRLCGSAPNYYEGYFNCSSNNYTLDQVFISLTNQNGVPLSNTTCTPGTSQQMYVMLNYTSNSNSNITQTRIFADLSIDGNVIPINKYLGSVAPGGGQRQIYGPFTWTCGQELRLCRILVVWQTSGGVNDPELSSYDCNTYSKSQCEFGDCMIVAAPLAVEYSYTGCWNGNQSTVVFQNLTSGGIAPYTYSWNFGDGSPISTQQNPTHNFPYPGGPYTVTLTVTDSNLPIPLVSTYTQVITPPAPITITGQVTSASCANQNNGAINATVSGGTPPYTYSWNNGQTTQDISGLAPGTYTLTVTDAFGCTKSQSFIIGNGDTSNPVITAPNDLSIEGCGPSSLTSPGQLAFSVTPVTINLAQFTTAGGSYTDASSISTITYQDVASGTCPTIVTRTFRLTDACGNPGSDQQIITIDDTTPPAFAALPAPSTINCPAVPQFAQAIVTDNCGPGFSLSHNDVTTPGQCAGSYSVTRTWTATDACGNTSTKTQTINVRDVTAPLIAALPATSTINCPAVPQFAEATATDNCGSAFTLTHNDVITPGNCAGRYSVTRTWTATDACQNTSTKSQTIIVQDSTPPQVPQAPPGITVSCSGQIPQMISLTANDACGGPITVAGKDSITAGSCSSSFTVTRTWTFTDACGNTSSVNQIINVSDTSDPSLPSAPPAITVSCAGEVPPMVSLTATDTCAGEITVMGVDTTTPGNCPSSYIITRRWTFADPCGNSDSVSQTITVRDTTPPIIQPLPAATTIDCKAQPQFAQAVAADNCNLPVTLTHRDVITPGQCPGSYSITRTWTATDACGNPANASQTINVQDTTPPVFSALPGETTIDCKQQVQFSQAQATDDCSLPIALTHVDVTTPGQCPGSYSVTRTWTAKDACGNPSTATQTINVQDTTPPVFEALPEVSSIDCTATPVFAQAVATDNCSLPIALTHADVTAPGQCPGSYSITRTWTAEDACGNKSTASQTINVQDTTPPVFEALPEVSTINCPTQPEFAQPVATDNCSLPITFTFADVTTPGQCAGSYSITRTWTAKDACGNPSTASQTINVQDVTAPVLPELQADITVSCASEVPAPHSLTAVDNCTGNITAESVDVIVPGSCPNSFVVTRTWTFTDACNNTNSMSQIITVSDETPPVLVKNISEVIEATCSNIPTPLQPEFADNCGGDVTVTYEEHVDPNSEIEGSYDIIRTWTATDSCGNQTVVSQTVHVTVGDTFNADNPDICNNIPANSAFNLMSLLPGGTEPGGHWVGVNILDALINHENNTLDVTQLEVGYYTLQYILTTEQTTCPRKLEFYVHVVDNCGVLAECDINVYNGFSPNNDGDNDILVIQGLECYAENKVQIYNRWGILVFEKSGYNNTTVVFDGKSEGRATLNKSELLPGGTYFYILKYKDNEQGNWHDKSGYLYLSR